MAIAQLDRSKQYKGKRMAVGLGAAVEDKALLHAAIQRVQSSIAPLWPLADYVAVNPFFGWVDQPFLQARERIRESRSCELLPGIVHYRDLYLRGAFNEEDLVAALDRCQREYPDWYVGVDLDYVESWLTDREDTTLHDWERHDQGRRYWSVAENIDEQSDSGWEEAIVGEVTKFCAAHFDQGQAMWESPWRRLPLFQAWRNWGQVDRRFEKLGVKKFRSFVEDLPQQAGEAIEYLLKILDIPSQHAEGFLRCQLGSVAGWAAYVKCQSSGMGLSHRHEGSSGQAEGENDLLGLLAIRLAYDVALFWSGKSTQLLRLYPEIETRKPDTSSYRYLLQVASEIHYQRTLCDTLVKKTLASSQTAKCTMVFCIDVRSEVIRRHIEAACDNIATQGFAGFFGLTMEYVEFGQANGTPQCPVLLSPKFRIEERVCGAGSVVDRIAIENRLLAKKESIDSKAKIWKRFQTSTTSCFSFVESMGLAYSVKLVRDTLADLWRGKQGAAVPALRSKSTAIRPKLSEDGNSGLPVAGRIDAAESILRNLGMTSDFSGLVVFCGHASETVNNPYQSALDCGACGGHSGENNARVAAGLLNDPEVRLGLAYRGIELTAKTWFVAAVHNTTTDEIRFLDSELIPQLHRGEYENLVKNVGRASEGSRSERAERLGVQSTEDVIKRSWDWSEVRPEWGLAGNASFIVAPRSRTEGVRLDGRTFMHSYDWRKDPQWKVLELIMTAPMIVTNWINMQYYASSVDNRAFGSGNKTLHNVVGNIGVLEGNSGDLMTGLPWQSVHDGTGLQHQPLRLSVFIEAPRDAIGSIVAKHKLVRDLVTNGWLYLIAIDGDGFYELTPECQWLSLASATS